MRFPELFGFETVTISFVELAANSAYIMTIFLMKQLLFSLFWPQKATVIRVTPVITFQPELGGGGDGQKNALRRLRVVGIALSVLGKLSGMSAFYSEVSGSNNYLADRTDLFVTAYYMVRPVVIILHLLTTICFISNKERLLWVAVLSSGARIVIYVAGVLLLEWPSHFPGGERLRAVLILLYVKKVALTFLLFAQFMRFFSVHELASCRAARNEEHRRSGSN